MREMSTKFPAPFESRRYRFHYGKLTDLESLDQEGAYLYQSREDFLGYSRALLPYLGRLAGNATSNREKCPFCSFTIDHEQRAYTNPIRVHPFVDKVERHLDLWNKGVIITSNVNGWHLVSELIIPRQHFTELDPTLPINEKLIDSSILRWSTHQQELLRILQNVALKQCYHGLVYNQRAGQSVSHFHYHCYTTIHPLAPLSSWLKLPVVCRTATTPSFEIRISLDDHPGLVAICLADKLPLYTSEDFSGIVNLMQAVSTIFGIVHNHLYGAAIPASFGWFLLPNTNPQLIYAAIPIKRHGTLQAFQADRFRKFNRETIVTTVKDIFAREKGRFTIDLEGLDV